MHGSYSSVKWYRPQISTQTPDVADLRIRHGQQQQLGPVTFWLWVEAPCNLWWQHRPWLKWDHGSRHGPRQQLSRCHHYHRWQFRPLRSAQPLWVAWPSDTNMATELIYLRGLWWQQEPQTSSQTLAAIGPWKFILRFSHFLHGVRDLPNKHKHTVITLRVHLECTVRASGPRPGLRIVTARW